MPSNKSPETLKEIAVAKLRLPHPYLTTYYVVPSDHMLQLRKDPGEKLDVETAKLNLHHDSLRFSTAEKPSGESLPPLSDNTPWARCQRAPLSTFEWDTETPPSVGQIWLSVYALLIMQPDLEIFRAQFNGQASKGLEANLKASTLAYDHPLQIDQKSSQISGLIVSRSAFWQGAGSPFGGRSPWTPSSRETVNVEPTQYTMTTRFPTSRVHQRHPRRPQKPTPGSVVYSRYIPSLDEHFSLIALDYQNEDHVQLFHTWQNDPRVAKGWNETGSLEEHREYLRKQHEDPHTLPVFGRFENTSFSYFEIYWAKEDHVGAHYDAGDYDRGRHSLVGDVRYRGRHRVLGWWSCIVHYIFLDDCRTEFVIGEPVATNDTVLVYDYTHGFHVDKYIDFPHKRAALVKVSRERFFQICPLVQRGGRIAGTGVPLPARL